MPKLTFTAGIRTSLNDNIAVGVGLALREESPGFGAEIVYRMLGRFCLSCQLDYTFATSGLGFGIDFSLPLFNSTGVVKLTPVIGYHFARDHSTSRIGVRICW
ncbi:MAG: hypothetical protein WAP20_00155 [Limnochordia bacterium]|nr:hypothetical protein [Limnochordia bacterium]HPZ31779.1 hypothetical protein [Limnochordia bacterium]HQD71590.1 hypothetical protein [Limnochordia bacterium]HXK98429.1 hypothetical protein [Limnochordia bacterium]